MSKFLQLNKRLDGLPHKIDTKKFAVVECIHSKTNDGKQITRFKVHGGEPMKKSEMKKHLRNSSRVIFETVDRTRSNMIAEQLEDPTAVQPDLEPCGQ